MYLTYTCCIYLYGIMCYPDIPAHCVHLLATLPRVIFQWWGGPPWAGRWGRVHFFWRRCKKCASRTLCSLMKRDFFLPATFFRRRASDLLMKMSKDPKNWKLEIERQKTRWLLLGYEDLFNDFWQVLCWILYDQSFSWNSNRPIPTHGLLDMASPAAFSCYESFLIQRFTPVPRWVLQSGVVGDVLNMFFFFVLKSL